MVVCGNLLNNNRLILTIVDLTELMDFRLLNVTLTAALVSSCNYDIVYVWCASTDGNRENRELISLI